MFKLSGWKRKKINQSVKDQSQGRVESETTEENRLSKGLARTRHKWFDGLTSLILGKKIIEPTLLSTIEKTLLTADVGVTSTKQIIEGLTDALSRGQLSDPAQVLEALRAQLLDILQPVEQSWVLQMTSLPQVILVVGVNGAGKTTTIGKLAGYFQSQGKKVLLAAGDTFRAAAIEQLGIWGARLGVPVVAQTTGADSASVSFDALQSAQSKGIDVVIIDTAGRLHTKNNLMEELKKINRVLAKLDSEAPHETLLVLDATTGQNGLRQAQAFQEAVGVTGLILTKLDGTAKGGVIFSIASALNLPIRFIGVGERVEDLRPFNAAAFVDALFNNDKAI